jgi:hypothetical protein
MEDDGDIDDMPRGHGGWRMDAWSAEVKMRNVRPPYPWRSRSDWLFVLWSFGRLEYMRVKSYNGFERAHGRLWDGCR